MIQHSNCTLTKMHLHFVILLCLTALLFFPLPAFSGRVRRVVNGTESLPNKWPFMAGLSLPFSRKLLKSFGVVNGFQCGAVIWSNDSLLTAAQCVDRYNEDPSILRVNLGHINRTEINEDYIFDVKEIIIHEQYKTITSWINEAILNDIALIRLAKPINFTTHQAIAPVPRISSTQLVDPQRCITLGWGAVKVDKVKCLGARSTLLREVDVSLDKCYPECVQGRGRIAAGDLEANKGPCSGDTGGPLICALADNPKSYVLVGIVSMFPAVCNFGLFTRLSTFTYVPPYLDWIMFHSGELPNANSTNLANIAFADNTIEPVPDPWPLYVFFLVIICILIGIIICIVCLCKCFCKFLCCCLCLCTKMRHPDYEEL